MSQLRAAGTAGVVGILCAGCLQIASAQSGPMAEIGVHVPPVVARSVMLGHSNPNKLLHVCISLPYGDLQGIQNFVDSVSDPKSRNYHQFITPEEVGSRFGLSLGQVQSVAKYLTANGMKVTMLAKNRLNILADGTVAQAEHAFGTTINEYQSLAFKEDGNPRYFSFSKEPQVPAGLVGVVSNITGLESYTKPQSQELLTPALAKSLYDSAPMCNSGFSGQGRTVGISSWDGFRLSNVPLYYSQYGLPAPAGGVGSNITVITISGGSANNTPGAEGDLDIQMVLGMAPLCNLRIYDGGSGDMLGVLSAENNDNACDIITESYGWSITSLTATSAHNIHLSMSAQGITYMSASGDGGTNLGIYCYPAFDPEVLSVGGSVATTDINGIRTSEIGWLSGGGGWSTFSASFNTLPSWQVGNGVPTNVNYRLVPDVALHSSGNGTGAFYFYLNGTLMNNYMGTSFSSPVFAGSLAVAEQKIISGGGLPANGAGKQRFGRVQNLFYSQNGRSDVWYDITSGSNGTLPDGTTSNAGPGWDFNTGWGAIDFNTFVGTQVPNSVPPVPTNVVAVAGNAKVSLSWSACAGAGKYHVKRTTTSGTGYLNIASPTTNSYTDLTAANGTTYYYVITSINSVGESSISNEVSATPTAPAPDFSMASTPSTQGVTQGYSANYTSTVSAINGFADVVNFSASGLPTNATASFNPASFSGAGSTVCTVSTTSTTPAGTYTITITASSTSLTHSNNVTLVVSAASVGDFAVSASPASITIRHGRSGACTITIMPSGGFTGGVTFSASGGPSGSSVSFSPSSVSGSGSTTMTVATPGNARGTFSIAVKATSGSLTHTTAVTITIS